MPDGNTFRTLLSPNAANATQDFMKAADVQKVRAARAERVKAMQAAGNLVPRAQGVSAQFDGASNSRALLARVSDFLPATFDNAAHVGLVAAQAGITSTLQFASGGTDGHCQLANSYNGANGSLARVTDLVTYIIDKSAQLGIQNRIFIRMYSEFRPHAVEQQRRQGPPLGRYADSDGSESAGLGQPRVRRQRSAPPAGEDRSGHGRGPKAKPAV